MHRWQGSLPYGLKLHYKTATGEDIEQTLSLVCEDGRQSLRDTVLLMVANGRIDLEGPSRVACTDAS